MLTPAEIEAALTKACRIAPRGEAVSNLKSFVAGALASGDRELLRPAVFAQYGCQALHESGEFRYDKEVWGPTPAQTRYEGRKDLGNTEAGDGKLFMGRTAFQLTGRFNYRGFTSWAKGAKLAITDLTEIPDFEKAPQLILTDPWEGLVPYWFWMNNKLTVPALAGDHSAISKRINGGWNGIEDRRKLYTRLALALLGRHVTAVSPFQREKGLQVDGLSGPATRMALHKALMDLEKGKSCRS